MAVLKFTQVSFIGRKIHPVGVVAALLAAGGVLGSTRTAGSILASSSRSDSAVTGKYHSQYSRGRVVDPQTNAILPANNIRAFA
jgi:hypothetical protein